MGSGHRVYYVPDEGSKTVDIYYAGPHPSKIPMRETVNMLTVSWNSISTTPADFELVREHGGKEADAVPPMEETLARRHCLTVFSLPISTACRRSARTEFYQHDANWSNRMILGDSCR